MERGDTADWSCGDTTYAAQSDEVFTHLIDAMPERTNAAMIVFDWNVVEEIPMGHLTADRRTQMRAALAHRSENGASLANGLDAAVSAAASFNNGRRTKIVLLTSGIEAKYMADSHGDVQEVLAAGSASGSDFLINSDRYQALLQACADNNCVIYTVSGNTGIDAALRNVTGATGGEVIDPAGASAADDFVVTITAFDGDMVRADTVSSMVLADLMLLLEGIVIGCGLWLLLSRTGQKRFQIILSPLMGIAAAILLKHVFLGRVTWIIEGLSLSLFGLVFMCRNNLSGASVTSPVDDWGSSGSFGSTAGGTNESDYDFDDDSNVTF